MFQFIQYMQSNYELTKYNELYKASKRGDQETVDKIINNDITFWDSIKIIFLTNPL